MILLEDAGNSRGAGKLYVDDVQCTEKSPALIAFHRDSRNSVGLHSLNKASYGSKDQSSEPGSGTGWR